MKKQSQASKYETTERGSYINPPTSHETQLKLLSALDARGHEGHQDHFDCICLDRKKTSHVVQGTVSRAQIKLWQKPGQGYRNKSSLQYSKPPVFSRGLRTSTRRGKWKSGNTCKYSFQLIPYIQCSSIGANINMYVPNCCTIFGVSTNNEYICSTVQTVNR